MGRPEYITEEFYKTVYSEIKRYSNDYNEILDRTRLLEELQLEQNKREEESYSILESFGTFF
jgi:hypothetical protein